MNEDNKYIKATMLYFEKQLELDREYRACLMQIDVNKLTPSTQRSYYDTLDMLEENEKAYKRMTEVTDFMDNLKQWAERWLK